MKLVDETNGSEENDQYICQDLSHNKISDHNNKLKINTKLSFQRRLGNATTII